MPSPTNNVQGDPKPEDDTDTNNGAFAPSSVDTSAIDAQIEELTRRRSQIAQSAGAAEPKGAMAGIAGMAADSFAQAFVDRFASSRYLGGEDSSPKDGAGMGGFDQQAMMCGLVTGTSGGNPNMNEMDFMSGQASFGGGPQMGKMNGMNGAYAGGGADMDMSQSGMNYPGMGMMGGMNAMVGSGFDRRGSQMSMNSMDGQAFQNWQQQQMSPYFQQMQTRMGMMGRDFPHGNGAMMNSMMMQNNTGFSAGMMQGMHPGMMFPGMQQMQQETGSKKGTGAEKQLKGNRKKRAPNAEIQATPELIEASKGPFKTLEVGMPLSLDEDKDWLTPLHCFVRRNCVEVFTATQSEVDAPSKGKRKPIQIGQVGIRCPHCHIASTGTAVDGVDSIRERGSTYYPSSLGSIYNATMNLLQRHLHSCPRVPESIMKKYAELKQDDARSGTSKRYWIESAKSIGFVDTLKGIRLSANAPPSLMFSGKIDTAEDAKKLSENSSDKEKQDKEDAEVNDKEKSDEDCKQKEDGDSDFKKYKEPEVEAVPLVIPSDKDSSTTFSYFLLSQMQPCVFTEADRLGKRKGLPTGFAGLACRHCFGGYGSGRFFPSSIKTLSDTSKTLNVLESHMTRCRKCPSEVLEQLAKAKETHEAERSNMKFGSQKAFFAKIWARLHDNRHYDPSAVRKVSQSKATPSDGSMSTSNAQTMALQYSPGMNNDISLMSGPMAMMANSNMSVGMSMMGGGQMPMMGRQHMGINPMMGMMPEMMMRGYPDQFMAGGLNNMTQFGGGDGNDGGLSQTPNLPTKRDVEDDDQILSNKRVREV